MRSRTTREQIAHLEVEKATIEAIRDRAISDAQRAAQAADYVGAGYRDLPAVLRGIRSDLEEVFSDRLLARIEHRLSDLNESIGRAA
ncbi:hypothetical protein [Xanthobacter sediminis]